MTDKKDSGGTRLTADAAVSAVNGSQLSHVAPENPNAFPAYRDFERMNDDTGRWEKYYLPEDGMELRDYFAARAMQSIFEDGQTWTRETAYADTARRAYLMADAMLKAREATK